MCVCDSTCLYIYSHCDKASLSTLGCGQRLYTYGGNMGLETSSCSPFPVSCSIAEWNLSVNFEPEMNQSFNFRLDLVYETSILLLPWEFKANSVE